MNGTAQKAHTKVTDDLSQRLDNVETVLAALDDRVTGVATAALASVREERTQREDAFERQRADCHGHHQRLSCRIDVVRISDHTLWDRLRWLIRGR